MADLILKSIGESKVKVIRIIRDLTGLGLQETKTLADRIALGQEYTISGLSEEQAAAAAAELKAAGADAVTRSEPKASLPEQEECLTIYRSGIENKCPHCGRFLKQGDAFCEGCGAPVGSSAPAGTAASLAEPKSTGLHSVYKTIAVIAAAIVIVFFIRSISSQDWEIRLVQNGILENYDYGVVIGDSLRNWFHRTEEWDCYTMQDITYVTVEGTTNHTLFEKPEKQRFVFQIIDKERFLFKGAYDQNGNLLNTANSNIYAETALNAANLLLSLQDNSLYELTLRGAFGDKEVLESFSGETDSSGAGSSPASDSWAE